MFYYARRTEQATAHGYPIQTARPAYDLFTV